MDPSTRGFLTHWDVHVTTTLPSHENSPRRVPPMPTSIAECSPSIHMCCSAVLLCCCKQHCTVQYCIPTAPTLHSSSCWCELSSVQLRQRKIPIAARCWCSQSRGGCANKSPLTPHSRPAACSAQATPHEWRSNCLYPLSRNRCGRSAERA